MRKYILNRLLISVITLFIITTASFFLLRTLPGNPFQSENLIPKSILTQLMKYYGLDRPLHEQYFTYMKNLLRGDFGYSLKYQNQSVNSVIAQAFPVSASIGLRALCFAYPVGLFLGTVCAIRRGKPIDYICVFVAILGVSIPSFIMAALLQYVFGVKLHLLPIAEWKGFQYTILPTLAMGMGFVAGLTRSMRASMLEVTSQDYIKTAKAKGLSTPKVIWRHQIRNAMLPMVTGMGPVVAMILTGSFVIEQIFAIPGLGRHYVESIKTLDYTKTLGLTVFFSIFLVAANFLVDLAYGWVDPRIRIAKEGKD